MSLHDTILCDISCYGSFSSAEREALVTAIGNLEVELASNQNPRYWACYVETSHNSTTFLVSCPELPGVLKAGNLEEILKLIEQQKSLLRQSSVV